MSFTGCTAQTVTPGIVVFSASDFIAQYPAFSTVSETALQFNFNAATLQLNNGCCSLVQDAPTRGMLLYLLTAHITALLNGINGNPAAGIVGRISSANEGSVSVQAEYSSTVTDTEAYYIQTPWGAQYWQSTLPYRTAHYVAPCWSGIDAMSPWESWPQ